MQGHDKKIAIFDQCLLYLGNDTIGHRAIVTIECEYETVPKLSNGTIFNDLERPLAEISRSRHYLTLNI